MGTLLAIQITIFQIFLQINNDEPIRFVQFKYCVKILLPFNNLLFNLTVVRNYKLLISRYFYYIFIAYLISCNDNTLVQYTKRRNISVEKLL